MDRLEDELNSNQKILEEILLYRKDLLLSSKKAYSNDSIRIELYKTGRLDIFKLAHKGIIKEIPSSTSWEITRQSGLSISVDFELLHQISKTYTQQDFVLNETIRRLSDKVFDPEINLAENQDQTLHFFMMASN